MTEKEELQTKNWKAVASTLNLNLGEVFMINTKPFKYFFFEKGLAQILATGGYCEANESLLIELLNGDAKICFIFLPDYGSEYFTLEINDTHDLVSEIIDEATDNRKIVKKIWKADFHDMFNLEIGNVFKTESHAEACTKEVLNRLYSFKDNLPITKNYHFYIKN